MQYVEGQDELASQTPFFVDRGKLTVVTGVEVGM